MARSWTYQTLRNSDSTFGERVVCTLVENFFIRSPLWESSMKQINWSV